MSTNYLVLLMCRCDTFWVTDDVRFVGPLSLNVPALSESQFSIVGTACNSLSIAHMGMLRILPQ